MRDAVNVILRSFLASCSLFLYPCMHHWDHCQEVGKDRGHGGTGIIIITAKKTDAKSKRTESIGSSSSSSPSEGCSCIVLTVYVLIEGSEHLIDILWWRRRRGGPNERSEATNSKMEGDTVTGMKVSKAKRGEERRGMHWRREIKRRAVIQGQGERKVDGSD